MKDKKKIIFCLVALIIIVVVLIMFFVFKDNKLINNNKNKTITENGVQLIVQNDNVISIKKNKKESNLLEFNLTNKTESISNYTIYLDSDNNIDEQYLKFELTKGEEVIESNLLSIGTGNNKVLDSGIIEIDEISDYKLRLFIKEGEKDKTFKAKLRLVAQPLIEPTDVSCFTFDESTRSITDYLCYSLNDQNLITEPNVIIPAYINEFPVLMIDSYAFYNKNLTSVVMQNNITTIGISAFEGNNLTSLTLSNSVTTIGSNAFLNNDLTNIVIPSSVTTIGENAFKNNNLTDVNILNGEINLAEFTFANNKINKLTVSEQLLPNLTMKSFVDNPICNETKYASLVMCQ